jgi:transcription elongation factor Elf1
MRAIVTCECCGHRQTVARPIRRPESFYLICHECERSLRVDVTAVDIQAAQVPAGRRAAQGIA